MKKHSTGALTKEQKAAQDKRYTQGHSYDYIIIGTGMSALSVGALLAHAGKKICMLEAHDVPGGMAHTFRMGDYEFCAQVHYIWGCAPGGRIYEFLRKIGLEKKITFQLLGPEGYDRMVMPDGKAVMIPYGFDELAKRIDTAYPGQRDAVLRFTKILSKIRTELRKLPDRKIKWWEYILNAHQFPTLLRYRTKTLQNVFDKCKLSKESQAVLIANAGDFMAPPKDLSIFAYCGLFGGYNNGAYYPTHHFKSLTQGLADFITSRPGCHIYYETAVSGIDIREGNVGQVRTADGKAFVADQYICNMDPQTAAGMIGWQHFPASWRKSLQYRYSPSGMMIYLGLKDIDLCEHGFGRFNTWHLLQWDMNKMWDEQGAMHFEKPWFFISTPSLHTNDHGTTPPGGAVMEIASYCEFDHWKELQQKDYSSYNKEKLKLADQLIDLVATTYVPDLRKHIAVKTIGTPMTHADFCNAPYGNAYGSYLDPKQIGTGRLKAVTPFNNLWWCNASSGFGGVHGTISTGMDLYMDLTGDRFFNNTTQPTDDEFVKQLRVGSR
ncbi:NAD(P)/FAD-dependent oxidoreductase [Candidatus Woesearchaeota archaeon]|nr:NAD(P)/FAD-dependent oxidoreductase [Candidatus Woesearchaeota archaeon]